jgi:hypothetical protein
MVRTGVLLIYLGAALTLCATAATKQMKITGDQVWTDTGVDLKPGDTVTITATGTVSVQGGKEAGPDGLPRGWTELVLQLPNNQAGRGALIGRFGDSPAARAFLVGAQLQRSVPVAGHLFLGINETSAAPVTGAFDVSIEVTASTVAPSASEGPRPPFTQEMLDNIPLRVNDAMGNPGDRVNFILIGSQETVQKALSDAGWVLVDKTKRDAVMQGFISSLSKNAYVSMPMSELELYGRVQDFGYAQADPIAVVASRHHFRIWRTPITTGGEPVWAGAGTHDIGFDRDQRTNGVTHKIDPQTDAERDYIGASLQQTGDVAKEEYMTPTHPVKEARTATGGGFTSNGQTLIIFLKSAVSADQAAAH